MGPIILITLPYNSVLIETFDLIVISLLVIIIVSISSKILLSTGSLIGLLNSTTLLRSSYLINSLGLIALPSLSNPIRQIKLIVQTSLGILIASLICTDLGILFASLIWTGFLEFEPILRNQTDFWIWIKFQVVGLIYNLGNVFRIWTDSQNSDQFTELVQN